MLRWIQRGLLAVGLTALALCAVCYTEAKLYQALQGSRLERALASVRKGDAGTRASARSRAPAAGELVGRLEIQRLGMTVIVGEGVDGLTLLHAAGHVPGTALPGEPGNVAVSGHRDSFFRGLRNIRRDDEIRIVAPEGSFTYRVDATLVVSPEDTEVLRPSDQPILTLVTCYPFHFIGSAPKRFIVRARQVAAAGRSSSAKSLQPPRTPPIDLVSLQ